MTIRLDTAIEEALVELLVPTRVFNIINNESGCATLRDLLRLTRYEILRLPNFGPKSLADLEQALAAHGYSIGCVDELEVLRRDCEEMKRDCELLLTHYRQAAAKLKAREAQLAACEVNK